MRDFILTKVGSFCDFSDNSIKTVFTNKDGNIIEMTLLQNRAERDVVCVPTHYFCRMGCKMCHLTNFFSKKPFVKIPVDEFNEALERTVCMEVADKLVRRSYKKDILISFMGVGEPLMNIELVEGVYKTDVLKNLGYDEVSYALATMFPDKEHFENLFEVVRDNGIPLKVHYSMHFPDDEERKGLIPNSRASLKEILDELGKYYQYFESLEGDVAENFRRFHKHGAVELHYTLIDGKNDHDWCYGNVKKIMEDYPFGIKFIKFNPIGDMKRSVREDEWIVTLGDAFKGRVKFYCPPGKAIGSSCGEFTKHFFIDIETEQEKNDFEDWKHKYEVHETIVNL